MPSGRNGLHQLLFLTVVATLFLCQVVGVLCSTVVPTVAATTSVQASHGGHAMAEENLCPESLASASEQGARLVQASGLPEPVSLVIAKSNLPAGDLASVPPKLGLPLYTLLSTLRI